MRDVHRCSVRGRGFRGNHDLCGALVLAQADNLRVLHPAQALELIRGVEEGRKRGLVLWGGSVGRICGGVYHLSGRGDLRLGCGLVPLRLLRHLLFGGSILGRILLGSGGWFGLGLGVDKRGQGAGFRVDRVGIDHGEERTVDAGAKALGHDVGGLALGGIGVRRGIGRKGKLHLEYRRGHSPQGEHDQRHSQAGHLLD